MIDQNDDWASPILSTEHGRLTLERIEDGNLMLVVSADGSRVHTFLTPDDLLTIADRLRIAALLARPISFV